MSDFGKQLVGTIPLYEAAEFFVALKEFGTEKTASSKVQKVISDLLADKMPEGKAGYTKLAEKMKLAYDGSTQTDTESIGQSDAAAQPLPTPPQAQASAKPPAKPVAPPTMPVNYLGAEQAGQKAQEGSESAYYHDQLSQASAENQAMSQQMQEAQQTVGALQAQVDQATQQVQETTQQATEANDKALMHSQESANMRMAIQQMRDQLVQFASQDPDAVAQAKAREQSEIQQAAAEQAGIAQAQGQDPNQTQAQAQTQTQAQAQTGPGAPAASPTPKAKEPSKPAAAAKPEPQANPVDQTKISGAKEQMLSALKKHGPYALGGAGLGALAASATGKKAPKYKEQAEKAEAEAGGGYRKALKAVGARQRAGKAEAAQQYPTGAMLAGGLGGAVALGKAGPVIEQSLRREIPRLIRNLKG